MAQIYYFQPYLHLHIQFRKCQMKVVNFIISYFWAHVIVWLIWQFSHHGSLKVPFEWTSDGMIVLKCHSMPNFLSKMGSFLILGAVEGKLCPFFQQKMVFGSISDQNLKFSVFQPGTDQKLKFLNFFYGFLLFASFYINKSMAFIKMTFLSDSMRL